jgi:CAAX protease family protein
MATTEVTAVPTRQAIAPIWHTILFVLIIVVFSFLGSKSTHPIANKYGHTAQYVTMIVWEWLMLLYTWWGLRRRGRSLRAMIGGKWRSFDDVLLDVAIAGAFWLCALVVLGALGFALRLNGMKGLEQIKRTIDFLAPQSGVQLAVFIALAFTAGFCEEAIFRGYFQQQFTAFSNATLGIVTQGVLFGLAHGYQGWKQMLRIAVFGIMFGVLAHWRKSLRPGMFAHAWQDTLSGAILYAIYRFKLLK